MIAQVHGWCVGGGSDMALCADIVIAAEDAQIGTPYSRMWGCYLTGMWLYRLGLTRAKWQALTGEPLSGKEAAAVELINKAVPFRRLEAEVRRCAERLAQIPLSQLAAMKLIVNQAYDNMGLHSTQLLGPVIDGYMRNTPEALDFVATAADQGVGEAVRRRDQPFGDYSQGPGSRKPRRSASCGHAREPESGSDRLPEQRTGADHRSRTASRSRPRPSTKDSTFPTASASSRSKQHLGARARPQVALEEQRRPRWPRSQVMIPPEIA